MEFWLVFNFDVTNRRSKTVMPINSDPRFVGKTTARFDVFSVGWL
jgi:hypothetical protein